MLNDKLNNWQYNPAYLPPLDTPLFILIEPDVVEIDDEDYPFIRKAARVELESKPYYASVFGWKLLDFDSETEEEILQQWFTVVAWRLA